MIKKILKICVVCFILMFQPLISSADVYMENAGNDLKVCAEAVLEIITLTSRVMDGNDIEAAKMVEPLEEVIDVLTQELKDRHIQRVQAGYCTLELGFIYNDCINNFERVADHCSNIAIAVLESADSYLQPHGYLRAVKQKGQEDYRDCFTRYASKYCESLSSEDTF